MRLALLLLLGNISYGQIPQDKQVHMIAGSLAGYYGSSLELSLTGNVHPFATSVGSAVLAGTIKELTDKNTTGFSSKDLCFTAVGGIVTGTIIYYIKKKHKKRNKLANKR